MTKLDPFVNTLIDNTTRQDILDLVVWGVTIAIIIGILMFVLGVFHYRH